eukprot:TRINITY_DN10660_c0_g1_i6.p1 TRINITY_DN10660_c0_g1~~TRINITY_DN10660_c0_g1_i6.p1  ORF type:complete len:1416 (-),score=256.66 TRINITY_DN10660_c0_g1_i6:891-5138(-)
MARDDGWTLHKLFERTVLRAPSLPAVQWKDQVLTYAELNTCADAVAAWLCRHSAMRGDIVALMLDRSLEMVVAVIGTLKAGAAYVPMLAQWPYEQRCSILEEAECRFLITQRVYQEDSHFFSGSKLELDDCRALVRMEKLPRDVTPVQPSDLAYIIYTSGSTGKPKGVMMHHGGTAANIALNANLSCTEGTRCCFSNTYTFDVHVADIFKPLSMGATIVITRDIFRIPAVDLVSTLPNKMSKAKVPCSLKTVIFTGEGLTEASVQPVPVTTAILNIFGATEFFDVTATFVDRSSQRLKLNSIGKPLGDYIHIWIVDPQTKTPKAVGEAGELVVGGRQVCRGYIKRPDLMDLKFFDASWLEGQSEISTRVYRTGDCVRLSESGEYEYLGRMERQVQLNGQRVDLTALEAQLTAIEGVLEAAVVVRSEDGRDELQLLAYVSPSSAATIVERSRSSGSVALPERVIGIDDWPRTSSGKIDRKRLPGPGAAAQPPEASTSVAEEKEEKTVRARWIFKDPGPKSSSATEAAAERDEKEELGACRTWAKHAMNVADQQLDELVAHVWKQAYRQAFVVFNKPQSTPPLLAPLTLLPTPVPEQSFGVLESLGPVFSRLVDLAACDVPWLMRKLEPLRDVDAWISQLLKLADDVYGPRGAAKDPRLEARMLLTRQDYLPHKDGRFLQVEINTIAVAFAGLTGQLAKVHDKALRTYRRDWCGKHGVPLGGNAPGEAFARALAAAHREYVTGSKQLNHGSGEPRVCFYCFQDDHLDMDQRHIAAAVEDLGVEVHFAFLGAKMELKGGSAKRLGAGGALFIDGVECSVVYFHCTYCPEHFANKIEWENRKLIELSRAIKAPSLLAHLVGCKKIQQVLTDPRELSRFLSPSEIELCTAVFARQFDPSSPSSAEVVKAAIAKPDEWVLKPQREGGGNNFYGTEMASILQRGKGLEEFVLMEKIQTPPMHALLLNSASVKAERVNAISELGIFACYLARPNTIIETKDEPLLSDNETAVIHTELVNMACGAMFRTKRCSSQEGGVCVGAGFIDTPFLMSQASPLKACDEASKTPDASSSTKPEEASLYGPPYRWLQIDCSCYYLANVYVKSVDAHYSMPHGDAKEDEFWTYNAERVSTDYAARTAIFSEARKEVKRRMAVPTLYKRNLEAARKRYKPLKTELFNMPAAALKETQSESLGRLASDIFHPEFLKIWAAVTAKESAADHIEEVHDDCFSSPFFNDAFCESLLKEVKNFKSQGIPHQPPSSMNKHGCILNEIGLGPLFDWIVTSYLLPVCRSLFPEVTNQGISAHHTFVVQYEASKESKLGAQSDNAEITINVPLSRAADFTGGKLALYHRSRSDISQQENLGEPYVHSVDQGTALLRPGDLLHRVLPVEKGNLVELVMLLRSVAYRKEHGCPSCRQTNNLLND